MKKISEHLGTIIVALAGIVLLTSVISFFKAPIGSFFGRIVDREMAVGNEIVGSIGDVEFNPVFDGEDTSETVDLTLFYKYKLNNSMGYEIYSVSLNSDFKTALNNNTDYVVDGETLWEYGTPLPNPGATYEGKPITSYSAMFMGCTNVTSLDLSGWDTSNVSVLSYLFHNCNNLTSLNVSGWDTSKVSTTYYTFTRCFALASLDLSGWDMSNVTDMTGMFGNCSNLASITVANENAKTKIEASSNFPTTCTVTVKAA